MEREGREEEKMRRGRREGEEVGRGRRGVRGGEKRKGIVIGGMILGLLLGCNNGGEDPQKVFLKSVVSLGNDFLTVFTSFGDMLDDVLGFSEKTTKSEVGTYFKKVKETVEGTKIALNKIVDDMKEKENPNASKTEAAVKTLDEKLTRIIEGVKKASDAIGDAKEAIGNVAEQRGGVAGTEVGKLANGIKAIVDVVLQGKGSATAGDANGPVKDADGTVTARGGSGGGGADGDARKLFANDNAGGGADAAKAAKDASKAVAAVTGSDILQAIANNNDSAKLAEHNGAVASIGTIAANAKDAVIAGAIALRAMAKDGKFSGPNDGAKAEVAKAVKGAAVSAVNKALDTLTIAIRKTIDEGLKEVKKAMNINANDNPITSETTAAAK